MYLEAYPNECYQLSWFVEQALMKHVLPSFSISITVFSLRGIVNEATMCALPLQVAQRPNCPLRAKVCKSLSALPKCARAKVIPIAQCLVLLRLESPLICAESPCSFPRLPKVSACGISHQPSGLVEEILYSKYSSVPGGNSSSILVRFL